MIRFSRDGKSVALFSFFYSFVFIIQIPQRQPNLNILTTRTRTIRASPVAQRKKSPCNAGATEDAGLIPGLEGFSGGGRGNPLQCSCLENPMYRGAWQATVHRVTKSWMWLKWLSMHTCTHVHTIPALVHIKRNYLSSFWWTQLRCWHLLCVLLAPPEDSLKDRAEEEASPISKVSSPFLPR